jgi:hypothetical protein
MIWTWVLPAVILFYAVAVVPTLTPEITSPMIWSGESVQVFPLFWVGVPAKGSLVRSSAYNAAFLHSSGLLHWWPVGSKI